MRRMRFLDHWRRLWTAGLALALAAPVHVQAVESRKTEPKSPDIEFAVDTPAGTAPRIGLSFTLEGRPLAEHWDLALSSLRTYADRNNDGVLSPAEAAQLPSTSAVRQILWNPVSPFGASIGAAATLDANTDGNVSAEELRDWYRRHGISPVTLAAGDAATASRTTAALLTAWDTNADGDVSVEELQQADQLLERLDANADELLAADELAPGLGEPVASATVLWPSDGKSQNIPALIRNLPIHRITNRDNSPPSADSHVLTFELTNAAVADSPHVLVFGKALRVTLRMSEGQIPGQLKPISERWRTMWREADANGDGRIEASELTGKERADARSLLEAIDRNADGQGTAAELDAWLAIQQQLAESLVQVGVVDCGRGLFEQLDANSNARLSRRELRRVAADNQPIDPAKSPRQLEITISRGRVQSTAGTPRRSGPEWFQSMDRNGDGDVSAQEFLGSGLDFRRLDRDGDELISADEAGPAH